MTPETLAKSNSEHAHQSALFCWANKAQKFGFAAAADMRCYTEPGYALKFYGAATQGFDAIPELRWLHAIANGGSRGDTKQSQMIRGGQLKAEGVKKGVADVSWPLNRGAYCGLYIEMKRPGTDKQRRGTISIEQEQFAEFVKFNNYYFTTCNSWQDGANVVSDYYNLKRG